jgi:uncharacterized membrane protein
VLRGGGRHLGRDHRQASILFIQTVPAVLALALRALA